MEPYVDIFQMGQTNLSMKIIFMEQGVKIGKNAYGTFMRTWSVHQAKLTAFCDEKGLVVTAYSPLANPARPWVKEGDIVLLEDEKLKTIAAKHSRDPGQILIRYQIQLNHVVIPKSVTKARIASNFDVFSFLLDEGDIKLLASLERNERINPEARAYGHPHHPFEHDAC